MTINGRVASLLEVGTGFHPELTGRENIYLNGAILGMARGEIKRKFDKIVGFAEVEKFLDTPVKRYSSGMYVRLAFAVAAHLEPEILIVDEVLAVGDAEFQRKCLGKMSEMSRGEGRTVLFVSHNARAVELLCDGCALLDGGKVVFQSSDVRSVIRRYKFGNDFRGNRSAGLPVKTPYFDLIDFSIKCHGTMDNPSNSFLKSDEIIVEIVADVHPTESALYFGYALYSQDRQCLWRSFQHDVCEMKLFRGRNRLRTSIPHSLLNNGTYTIEFLAASEAEQDWLIGPSEDRAVLSFSVQGGHVGSSSFSEDARPGILNPPLPWEVKSDLDATILDAKI